MLEEEDVVLPEAGGRDLCDATDLNREIMFEAMVWTELCPVRAVSLDRRERLLLDLSCS